MGKAKKTKTRQDLIRNNGTPATATNTVSNDLEGDMASLDENKRLKACVMLTDLFAFNISNKMSLNTLASSQILGKLSMRLVDSSDRVRIQAAQALNNLSDSKDSEILSRVVNLGLFRAAVTLSMERACLSVNDGAFTEQLFLTIANIASQSASAVQELAKNGTEFTDFLLTLLDPVVGWSVVSAVANLLTVVTGLRAFPTKAGLTALINCDQLVSRVWSIVVELRACSEEQLRGNSVLRVILVQCSEVLCNIVLLTQYSPSLLETCHITSVLELNAQLLRSACEGLATIGQETNISVSNDRSLDSYATIKLVTSFLLNLLESLSGFGASAADGSSPAAVDIEEKRATSASLAASERFQQFVSLLDQSGLPTLSFAALGQVASTLKTQIAQCVVVAASTPMEGGESTEESSSVVITKAVSEGLEVQEQLLNVSQQYVLLRAVTGAFAVDLLPFVSVAQSLLDMVTSFTDSVDSNKKRDAASWQFEEGVNGNSVRDTVLVSAANLLEFFGSLSKVAFNSANGSSDASVASVTNTYLYLSEEAVKALALLLIRSSSSSYLELALPAVLVMGVLGQRGDQIVTLRGDQIVRLALPLSIHTLLTNSLLRRLQEPNAYSADNSTGGNENVVRSTMVVMDACLNSVIDLHSSDDLDLLQNFVKLRCIEKLQQSCQDFLNKLRDPASRHLNSTDRDKFEESYDNISNFINYKQDFIRNN